MYAIEYTSNKMNNKKGVPVTIMRNKGRKRKGHVLCRKEWKIKEEKAQAAE